MNFTAISVKMTEFMDKQTGGKRLMWQVYCKDSVGGIGSLFVARPCNEGDTVNIDIVADRSGKLVAKIKDIIPKNNQNASSKNKE